MVVDPVCKMEFSEKDAKVKYNYKGKTYYFCCEMCKDKFTENPEKYSATKAPSKSSSSCCC